MNWSVALRLGRVSNLPTVWSNALAGAVLAGQLYLGRILVAIGALSLLYVGGMFLNDGFDRQFDGQFRPNRPIPAGEVSARTVFIAGFGLIGTGTAVLFMAGPRAGLVGLVLAGTIVIYDIWHKANPVSPLVMGLCRLLSYVAAAYVVAGIAPVAVWVAALVSLCYLIGLTYAAKQETLRQFGNLWPLMFLAAPFGYAIATETGQQWPAIAIVIVLLLWVAYSILLLLKRSVSRSVACLIAGISLVDALFVATADALGIAALAIAAFVATLLLQRWVAGT